jgi:hypothetical protein
MTPNPRESEFWPADNSAAIGHVNLIQGIISRLANNSASCKTWCLTLVSAFIAFAGASHLPEVITAALVTVVLLGLMDILYLAREIADRRLYDRVVTAMRNKSYALGQVFEVSATHSHRDIAKATLSWSIFPFYGTLVVLYIVAYLSGWLGAFAKAK